MPLGEMPHILVVDDDTRLRELLRKYLSDNEFRVTVAADAGEARDRMAGLQFDFIVLDRMMPGEGGLDFVHNLRPSNPVPILMLTAMGEVEARIDGLEAGVDDYLAKPFEPENCCCAFGQFCAGWRITKRSRKAFGSAVRNTIRRARL